jgi:hypothetical protein
LAAAADALIEDELHRIIRNTGFKPVQCDTLYRTMFLNWAYSPLFNPCSRQTVAELEVMSQ